MSKLSEFLLETSKIILFQIENKIIFACFNQKLTLILTCFYLIIIFTYLENP